MSTTLFSLDIGKVKKGNGVEFLQHQEKTAQRKNLGGMRSHMNTRDNLYYTKLRDDIEEKYRRLNKYKNKEIENRNEKMYGKLLYIIHNEKRSISNIRAARSGTTPGPISLNMAVRRRQIKDINRGNQVISERLMAAQCLVPNKEAIEKHITKNVNYKRTASTRKVDGNRKLDPLTQKRKAFVEATSNIDHHDAFNLFSSRDVSINNTLDNIGFETDANKSPINVADGSQSERNQLNMLQSARQRSARRNMPFNVENMTKHSLRTKLSELEHGGKVSAFIQSGMLSPKPLRIDYSKASQLKGQPLTEGKQNQPADNVSTLSAKRQQQSPLRETIELIEQQSNPNLVMASRNLHKTSTVSGMGMSQASSTVEKTSKTPLYKGTRFSLMGKEDHIGAVKRVPFDANDIKLDLIFDENEKIEKQMRLRAQVDDQKLDPFMKEFLSRNKNKDVKAEKISTTYFHQRNRSVQMMPANNLPEKVMAGIVHQMQGSQTKEQRDNIKDAYGHFVNYQAKSNAKMMLNQQSSFNEEASSARNMLSNSKLRSNPGSRLMENSKKSLSPRKKSTGAKSPLDVHDYTNMQNVNDPDMSKFSHRGRMMNQSSSQKLDQYGDEANMTPAGARDNRENPSSSNVDASITKHINSQHDDTYDQLPLNDTMNGTNTTARKLNKKLQGSSSKKNNSMKNRNGGAMAYSVGQKQGNSFK